MRFREGLLTHLKDGNIVLLFLLDKKRRRKI
jgi:hypothetical protein